MEEYTLNLGYSEGRKVPYMFSNNRGNKHLIAFGMSGYGKSTFLSMLEKQLIPYDVKILEIDYSDSSKNKQMLNADSHIININRLCSPFSKRHNVYGIEEKNIDYAYRISDVISGALRLTSKQKVILSSATKRAAEQYEQISFKNICLELDNMKNPSALFLKLKLDYLADKDVFQDGNNSWKDIFEHKKPIQVLSLSDFPIRERKIIAEILLEDLKNYVIERGIGNNNFFLILDECQELSFNNDMPTTFFMRQGRKYGCGVWLATQSPSFFKRDELALVKQAGLILNFLPNENERKSIVKTITTNDKEYKKFLEKIQELDCGQFIATGAFVRKDGSLSPRSNLVIDKFDL